MTDQNNILRWEQKLQSYHKALNRLAEVVNSAKSHQLNDLEKDGMVKRFEYTHEMAWKLMMSYCKYVDPSFEVYGSRDATRWAFSRELIDDGETWMEMIKSRNNTAHNYDGDVSNDVLVAVTERYFPLMHAFYLRMAALSPTAEQHLTF